MPKFRCLEANRDTLLVCPDENGDIEITEVDPTKEYWLADSGGDKFEPAPDGAKWDVERNIGDIGIYESEAAYEADDNYEGMVWLYPFYLRKET